MIDAGVFHNDVISVGSKGVFLCHGSAFANRDEVMAVLKEAFWDRCGAELKVIDLLRHYFEHQALA